MRASGAAARKSPKSAAADRVVDNIQPVSSRNTTDWAWSKALTRRVSKRSLATKATGKRPALRCCTTQAAARWASSSASSHACPWA